MHLKLFRAAGMAEAIAQVRVALGPDALILNSRNVPGGIEITAALEPETEPLQTDPARLAALTWHGVPRELHPALAHGNLEAAIAGALAFGELLLAAHAPPVMLTGPPGAGKTLTAVRLATRLVMSGTAPLVITTDGKRAGATEQLAAFTRLLGVPLLVASHPVSLARALLQRTEGAPVLIDTAGADPREAAQAEELRGLAATSGADIALVLPSGLDPVEAAELAVAHAECGATSLIVTRLDLANRLGSVIAAAAASRLPLVEAGIGAGAADGLVPFTPSLLAAMLSRSQGKHHAG
jgi:flagellar biosynthesis protein FlhF